MIFNWSIFKKEVQTGLLSKSFYAFFLIMSLFLIFSFYAGEFFSDDWYPNATFISMGFILSIFFSAYAGYLVSMAFAWELENNTLCSLIVHTSRKEVFWSKTLAIMFIVFCQILLLTVLIAIIGTTRGTVSLYFIILFLQILGGIYVFAMGAYSLTLIIALLFRRVAYPVIIGVVYGLLVIIGFIILSNSYSPGITYLVIDYSFAWSPVHQIPYIVFAVIEWGFIPPILIFYPLVWIIPVIFLASTYFGGCDI